MEVEVEENLGNIIYNCLHIKLYMAGMSHVLENNADTCFYRELNSKWRDL